MGKEGRSVVIVTEEAKGELHALARAALPEGRNLCLETIRDSAIE